MNTTPTTTLDTSPAPAIARRNKPDGDPARDAAQSFLATALIQPILKQLRQTNNAAEPFAPGEFEKQFAPLMDQIWSEQLARANDWPLVEAVAQRLREQSGLRPAPRPELNDEAPPLRPDFRAQSSVNNTARNALSGRGWLG